MEFHYNENQEQEEIKIQRNIEQIMENEGQFEELGNTIPVIHVLDSYGL